MEPILKGHTNCAMGSLFAWPERKWKQKAWIVGVGPFSNLLAISPILGQKCKRRSLGEENVRDAWCKLEVDDDPTIESQPANNVDSVVVAR